VVADETLDGCWSFMDAGVGLWIGGQRLHTAGLASGINGGDVHY